MSRRQLLRGDGGHEANGRGIEKVEHGKHNDGASAWYTATSLHTDTALQHMPAKKRILRARADPIKMKEVQMVCTSCTTHAGVF
jgi:hypothetical protein